MLPNTGWHGFHAWVDFAKATISLGLMLTTGLFFILTFALDGRYADKGIEADVQDNGQVARAVQSQLSDLKVTWIESEIIKLKDSQCQTASGSRSFYTRRIQDLSRQYAEITGHNPQIPSCDDF